MAVQTPDQMGTLGKIGFVLSSFANPQLPMQYQKALQDQKMDELNMQNVQSQIEQRRQAFEEARQQRARQEKARQALGSILSRGMMPDVQGAPNPQALGTITPQQIGQLYAQGADLGELSTLQDLITPEKSDLQKQLETMAVLSQMPKEQQDMYRGLFGKGGTTVNVGGAQSPFQEKFEENLGKGLADKVNTLETEAADFYAQTSSAEQALNILESNPNIDISPTSKISTQALSLFSPFLDENQLKNVADYQTLESQLIRNRFDVTKVLKGAITEQEQAAAQQVAGSATGTRQGLTQTLKNNMAYATLEADYRQRKADYIRATGRDYSEKQFNEYYKQLGETGQRPTLESMLSQTLDTGGVKFLGFE